MALYRAFLMSEDERIAAFHLLECVNDVAVMEEAASIRGCCSFIEVWEGARVVGRVRPAEQRVQGKQEPELLAEAMEQMGQAFAIFDSQDRLVTFNQRYLQVRSAIGDVVPGLAWLDLVKASLDRHLLPEAIGREKQWLDWRKRVRGAYSVLRELPDGTVWQVDERRMPSGVVVVWTDVSKLFGRTRDELLLSGTAPDGRSRDSRDPTSAYTAARVYDVTISLRFRRDVGAARRPSEAADWAAYILSLNALRRVAD